MATRSTESWAASFAIERRALWHRPLATDATLKRALDLGCFNEDESDSSVMAEHIYKKIELVGSSPQGFQAAVENALARASQTIRNMRWFEVMDTRGQIEDGVVNHWQVTLKVGFTLDKQNPSAPTPRSSSTSTA